MKPVTVMIIVLSVLTVCGVVIFLRSLYERNSVAVTNVNIALKGLHGTKKAAFFADFHSAKSKSFQKKILKQMSKNGVEIVLIAGDMVIGKKNADNGPALDFLKKLCEKYHVYLTFGNHETRIPYRKINDKSNFLEEIYNIKHLHIINNDVMKLKINNISVNLYGLELTEEYYNKTKPKMLSTEYITEKLGEKKEGYTILMSHKPDYVKQYHEYGADLVLSGHNHGGIVRLPMLGGILSTSFQLFPKYSGGIYYERNTIMILTRGLGTHTINFRLFNKPELVVINFKPFYSVIKK
ncbi:MAG: metallophosphoesterase [Lachnospiraceae bacterium]|nr:metallophosphoesterase [Lachnospiraceae bacterium]